MNNFANNVFIQRFKVILLERNVTFRYIGYRKSVCRL